MNAIGACLHCGLPMGATSVRGFCCQGCATVYELLRGEDLDRYYQLRTGPGSPVTDLPDKDRDLSWLQDAVADDSTERETHLKLDIQGIHCAACVWLIEKTFSNQPGALRIIVNPALGSMECWFSPPFSLPTWVRSVERFGYRFGPALKTGDRKSDGLLLRLGISIALAINVMMLSVALYLGLSEGRLYDVFRGAIYGLATVSVLMGGPVFMRSAIAGLRNGILHLDVPISIGIILAYAGSSWGFWTGRDNALYLDSVSVFIALMLLGRYLQGRVLSANRDRLLANDGTDGLRSQKLVDGSISTIKSTEIVQGDTLLIPPGSLIPIEATLHSANAQISTDWINGESKPQQVREGQSVLAGSFNAGASAITVLSQSDWDASPLEKLLRPPQDDALGAHEGGLSQFISSYYVGAVLTAALIGFGFWFFYSHSGTRALEVATAVLVVTCPCAFGIASPLAHEMVQAKLRREGVYLRSGNFLNQALKIRKIVFDKTGTMTTGKMRLQDPAVLQNLSPVQRQMLFDLCSQSSHPTSKAIAFELENNSLKLSADRDVQEVFGMGMECREKGEVYRLGRAQWATESPSSEQDTVFSHNGQTIITLATQEEPRLDAAAQIELLHKDGYQLYLLSGDSQQRVMDFGRKMGFADDHIIAEQDPEQKRQWIASHRKEEILFLGDGINDSLAAQEASCSGTPALDRPFMASHCDFYLGSENIAPLRFALQASRTLHRVIRRNLVFALIYNVCAIGVAWAGLMSPWLAAILMPTSSIVVVLATSLSLSTGSKQWKL